MKYLQNMTLKKKIKPPNFSSEGFNNLSHAVPMDGVKSGPDENRTHI